MTSGLVLVILRVALLISLYIFLGWALFILWRDITRTQRAMIRIKPVPIYLTHQSKINKDEQKFEASEIIIGRDAICDFVLDDNAVSAQHAILYYRKGHWWIEDMHSTNGTFLNDELISHPVVLVDKDLLRCGQEEISVRLLYT